MTDKQFWMKLDQLNSSSISSELKAAKLFKQAATEGLSILVVGRKGEPERREIGEDLSFFLCYTSRKHAQEDRDNGGMWSTYPVSKMYETILSDDKIGGIVLNSYSDQHIRFLTSTMLKMEEKELESLSSYSDAKDLLKKGRALETEIKDRIANGEIVPEETQHNIAEHSRLLDDLESLLSTSTDRGDAPGKLVTPHMVAASLAASRGRIHLSGHNLSGSRLTYLSIFHVRSLTYLSIYQEFVRVF